MDATLLDLRRKESGSPEKDVASKPDRPGFLAPVRRKKPARFAGLAHSRKLPANYFGRKVIETLPNCQV